MIDSKRECETSVSPNSYIKRIAPSLNKERNLKNNFFKKKIKSYSLFRTFRSMTDKGITLIVSTCISFLC